MEGKLPIHQLRIAIGGAGASIPKLQTPLAKRVLAIQLRKFFFRLIIQFSWYLGEGDISNFSPGQEALETERRVETQGGESNGARCPGSIVSVSYILLVAINLNADLREALRGRYQGIKLASASG